MGDLVLLALDDSVYAENAFDWYFAHMHKPGNRLVFTHAMEIPAVPTRESFSEQNKESKDKGKALVDKFSEKLAQHGISSPEFILDYGKPGEMIVEVAEKKDVTAIVMGTRGMGKLARTFLGSVSNYVLNHAPCPVLVCRLKNQEK